MKTPTSFSMNQTEWLATAKSGILEKHLQTGGDSGLLGAATSDMQVCADNNGYFIVYEKGRIYWTYPTGAYDMHGPILKMWESLGFEQSAFGFPIGDEQETMDGTGRYKRFQGGIIYWNPSTGVQQIEVPLYRLRVS